MTLAEPAPGIAMHAPAFCGAPPLILGYTRLGELLVDPVQPAAHTLFAPRGACLHPDGSLWVADSGHHRLLGWDSVPRRDGQPANHLLGQADWDGEGRNGSGEVARECALNLPVGVAPLGAGLALADAWNHRVLIWRQPPRGCNVAPDLVLGQADFSGRGLNRERGAPGADTLYWPFTVHWDGECLYVADTGNRRILGWYGVPGRNGQPADFVLGQHRFDCRDENAGGEPGPFGMRWPHSVCTWNGRLCVADAGSSRIMVWDGLPRESGQVASLFLGQADALASGHNGGRLAPDATVVNMPYAISAEGDWLYAADTANSRLLAWHRDDLANGAPARGLFGQPGFGERGENRWQAPGTDTLCWPYAVQAVDGRMVVTDTGNHRVLLLDQGS